MPEAALAAEQREHHLRHGLGGRAGAARVVTLSFAPGRLVLVMGPSGSGKTTLLSVLGCMLLPDRGGRARGGPVVRALTEGERVDLRWQVSATCSRRFGSSAPDRA